MSSSRSRASRTPPPSRKPPNGSHARNSSLWRAEVGKMLLSPRRESRPGGRTSRIARRSPSHSSSGSGGMRGMLNRAERRSCLCAGDGQRLGLERRRGGREAHGAVLDGAELEREYVERVVLVEPPGGLRALLGELVDRALHVAR